MKTISSLLKLGTSGLVLALLSSAPLFGDVAFTVQGDTHATIVNATSTIPVLGSATTDSGRLTTGNTPATPGLQTAISYLNAQSQLTAESINAVFPSGYYADPTALSLFGYGSIAEVVFNTLVVNSAIPNFGSGYQVSFAVPYSQLYWNHGGSYPYIGVDSNGTPYGPSANLSTLRDPTTNAVLYTGNSIAGNHLPYGFTLDLNIYDGLDLQVHQGGPSLSDFLNPTPDSTNSWKSQLTDILSKIHVSLNATQLAQLDPNIDPGAWLGVYSYGQNADGSSFAWADVTPNLTNTISYAGILNQPEIGPLDMTPTPEVNTTSIMCILGTLLIIPLLKRKQLQA